MQLIKKLKVLVEQYIYYWFRERINKHIILIITIILNNYYSSNVPIYINIKMNLHVNYYYNN